MTQTQRLRGRLTPILLAAGFSALTIGGAVAAEKREPFQLQKSFGCVDTPFCTLDPLRAGPSTGRLEVEQISCHFATYPPATRVLSASLFVVSKNGKNVFRHFLMPVLALQADYAYTDATAPTFFIVPAGGKVIATVNVPNATDHRHTCSISGHRVTPG